MAKTKISEFDVDPANNTDINSINIAEGCAPSGINNAIRQLMSDLKAFQTGADGDPFNGAVNGTVGATTPASGAFTSLSASGAFSANGGATLGDASGDALTINSSAVSIPNGLNFDSNTFVIDATNNAVGIGTNSPASYFAGAEKLVITKAGSTGITIDSGASGNSNVFFARGTSGAEAYAGWVQYQNAAKAMIFGVNASERMRIDSSGNLLVGTTGLGTDGRFQIIGISTADNVCVYRAGSGRSNGNYIFQNSSGTQVGYIQTSASATSYVTSSDYRLKEDIAPMTGALATVSALKPVTYTWKSTGVASQGFIAHELQEVVPDCVTGEKDAVDAEGNPQYQGIDTSFLVATLTCAIQELKAELDTLKAQINQ